MAGDKEQPNDKQGPQGHQPESGQPAQGVAPTKKTRRYLGGKKRGRKPLNLTPYERGKRIELRQRKIFEMLHRGITAPAIAKAVGVSTTAVYKCRRHLKHIAKELAQVRDYQAEKADICDAVTYKLLKTATQPDKLQKATLSNLMYGAQISNQMAQLARGRPTDISAQLRFCARGSTEEKPAIDVTPKRTGTE